MKKILTMVLAGAMALMCANIDGKWVAEIETKNKKGAGKQNVTLDLKADGSTLTGSVAAGKRARSTDIQNGKLDGDKFSFTTVQKGKQGEQKLNWTGTVAGSELKIDRSREGAKRAQSFTAKKQ
jgi:hypothetical protein